MNKISRMTPAGPSRRWMWRALVSALAGGGITPPAWDRRDRCARRRRQPRQRRGGHDDRRRNHDDRNDDGNIDDVDADPSTHAPSPARARRPRRRRRPPTTPAQTTSAESQVPAPAKPAGKRPPWCCSAGRRRPPPRTPARRARSRAPRRFPAKPAATTSPPHRRSSRRRQKRWPPSSPARRPRPRRWPSTASRCSCCRSTRRPPSSTACRGRSSRRSTKSRPTTAPTSRCPRAGAVGWMQFMPATWIQYGVDALNAGYADPYNPVDAIFAAARYLRAAGAATDLHARDPRLQPLRGIRPIGAAAGEADLELPQEP